MSLTPEDASDKALNDREATSSTKRLVEELGTSTLSLRADEIFGELFDVDPVVELAKPSPKIEKRTLFALTQDNTVPGSEAWKADSGGPLRGWIPEKFGSGYTPQFFDSADTLIPQGDQINRGFRWNSKTGILTIEDVSGLSLPPKITAYRYVGQTVDQVSGGPGASLPIDEDDLRGSYATAVDETARDGIPGDRREVGMIRRAEAEARYYRLKAGLTNADWERILVESGYVTLADLAERNTLTATMPSGIRVRVRTLPYVFELSLTDWVIVERIGNHSQLFIDIAHAEEAGPPPAGPFDGVFRYIDPSNISGTADDENDGLSRTTPWLTGDRAFSEIPDDARLGTGAFGGAFLYYAVMSDGFAPPSKVEFNNFGGTVNLIVAADLDVETPVETFGTVGAGANPISPDTLATTSTLASQFAYTGLGAFTAVTADDTHFVAVFNNFGGLNQWETVTIDGTFTDGPGGELRALGRFDPIQFDTTVRLFSYASHAVQWGLNELGIVDKTILTNGGRTPLALVYAGFKADTSAGMVVDNVRLDGCLLDTGNVLLVEGGGFGPTISSGPVLKPPFLMEYKATQPARGLAMTAINFSGEIFIDALMVRASDIGDGMIHFGGVTGDPTASTNVTISRLDLDGQGTERGFQARRYTVVRLDTIGIRFIDVTRAFLIQEFSMILNNDMLGSQSLASIIRRGAQTTSLSGVRALTDGLQNRISAGDNVVVGGDPVIYDMSAVDLPKTDVVLGDTSELCRAA